MNAFDLAEVRAVLRRRETGYNATAGVRGQDWFDCIVSDHGKFVAAMFRDEERLGLSFVWRNSVEGYNLVLRMTPAKALDLALDLRDEVRTIESIDGQEGVMSRVRIMRGTTRISSVARIRLEITPP